MLERLHVRGLGIIDAVEIELRPGFIALTGETGAGKSLLVTSLELLAGRRGQSDLVRTGDDRLRVEGWFRVDADDQLMAVLSEIGVDSGDELVIRREVSAAGRGRCWVNDIPVTVNALQQLAPHLLSIHGQHEQHGLADPTVQRRLVDDAADHDELLAEVAGRYTEWRTAADELASLEAARVNRRDRLDAIAFQLGEIAAVDPQIDEHTQLTARRQLLRHAARVRELATSVLGRLSDDEGSVVEDIARAEREVDAMVDCGLPTADASQRLAEARIVIEEVVRDVRALTGDVDQDPDELEVVENRLHRLERLMLKYGDPLEKVFERREALVSEAGGLGEVEDRLDAARAAAAAAIEGFDAAASRLDVARRAAGERLAREVESVLAKLNMAGTRLDFLWRASADDRSPLIRDGVGVAFDAGGVEQCEIQITANPGEEPRPMARIASGGELSRIHLALRTVLRRARSNRALTLLFDEVDTGLGGATAAALARLLGGLAETDQVMAVTHLPQVAAGATAHFRVDKVDSDGRSVTRVEELDDDARELEVARMLAGGELGASARAHARTLLESS